MNKQIYYKREGYSKLTTTYWMVEKETDSTIWLRQIGQWYNQMDKYGYVITCPNTDIVTDNVVKARKLKAKVTNKFASNYGEEWSYLKEYDKCEDEQYDKDTCVPEQYHHDFSEVVNEVEFEYRIDSNKKTYSAWIGDENVGAVKFDKNEVAV